MNQPEKTMEPREYSTVLSHFYRGELGRIMIWRQRLDVTTNWAIVGATGMITFGLGSPEQSHLLFLFANFLVFLLLAIEARRYRYYDAFRARVRMLEAHFLMPTIMRDAKMLRGDWKEVMSADLVRPTFKMSALMAILRRYRRNYVWIFLLIAVAWFSKIWFHYVQEPEVVGFFQAVRAHTPVPEGLFWIMVGLLYSALLALTIAVIFHKGVAGEFATKAMRRYRWLR